MSEHRSPKSGTAKQGEPLRGRASGFNPANKYERLTVDPFDIDLAPENYEEEAERAIPTEYFVDSSKSVLSKNDSPDVPFTYSINPYRGCEHGCIYCYARPTHEYLGFSSGLDFESKIMVKHDAPELLEKEFQKKSWKPAMICMSGNTDCYQPIERKLMITRRCLEVFLKYRNPVGIISKNALMLRDLDLLRELAALKLVSVTVSVTSRDPALIRRMEPRTSTPERRFDLMETLVANGVHVYGLISPVIPGLNDEEIPAILTEMKKRGVKGAGFTMVRFPGQVLPLFLDWAEREMPERAPKIINRIKEIRGGKLTEGEFGKRMSGEGQIAQTISKLFKVNCEKLGMNGERFAYDTSNFVRHAVKGPQIELF
jgi:DNA repair photolyase